MRWAAALAALLLVIAPSGVLAQRDIKLAAPPANEQRVALVIGNGAYKHTAPLVNPPNDARLMAETLASLGFRLIGGRALLNADKPAMEKAIREFGQRLRGGAVGLFYYAGHGVQVRGENYLIPVAANIADESDVKYELVSAGFVLDEMANANNRLNVVILDACRNNPFGGRGLRSAASGLAQVTAPAGTVISYATQPGNVALDGSAKNSPYSAALAAAMRKPGLGVFETFNEVGLAVKTATRGRQQPWFATSPIEGTFQFVPGAAGPPIATAAPADHAANDRAFWESVKDSKDPEEFKAYLDEFPSGRFAGLARTRLKSLTAAVRPPTQVASVAPSTQAAQPTPVEQGLQDLAAGSAFKDCDGCPEMVVIPSGSYDMGGSRRITLSRPFAVGKTEISFAQWDACVTEGGCTHRPDDRGFGRGNQPVMNVSWGDAKQYVAWLARKTGKSYRLLTEAEWEYAARAGTTTAYYWGDSDSDICQYASVDKGGDGCGTNRTSPVASKRPNAFGLYDMLGNVWEWVEDCYGGIDGVPSDGNARTTGDCGRRVLRGGSWGLDPFNARSGHRFGYTSTYRYYDYGFRVARTF
jgi:formylglycine-generating enzyme required for sulfatase activity/uncharacterized caspase-like protein